MIDLQPDLELTTAQAELVLNAWLDDAVACSAIVPLEGGMVNSVFALEFDKPPHRAVVKLHGPERVTFAEEARSLAYLGAETACPVPTVYLHDSSARLIPYAFLLLELMPGVCLKSADLEPADRADIEVQLAHTLGELHQHQRDSWGGIDSDEKSPAWADLFVERLVDARAHPALLERLTPDVLANIDRAIGLAPEALRDSGNPTLIHGDVWEGNMMVRLQDDRWRLTGLLDPDLQFADVEVELAYLEVFDHVRTDFFNAYADHHTLRIGYEQRRLFYWLHTALIHVALFGDDFFVEFTARTAERIGQLGTP